MKVCMFTSLKTNIFFFLGYDLPSPNTACLKSDLQRIQDSMLPVPYQLRGSWKLVKRECASAAPPCFIFEIKIDCQRATFV